MNFPVIIRMSWDSEPEIIETKADLGRWLASYDAHPATCEHEYWYTNDWSERVYQWVVYRHPINGRSRDAIGISADSEREAWESVVDSTTAKGISEWLGNDWIRVDDADDLRASIEDADDLRDDDAWLAAERAALHLLESSR